jgi:tetratricopeptide (TPR) repeat protein
VSRMDPHHGIMLVSPLYWKWQATAHWMLGDHGAELASAREGVAQFPQDTKIAYLVIRARAARGEAREVEDLLPRAVPGQAPPGMSADTWIASMRYHAARILRSAGNEADANRLFTWLCDNPGVWSEEPKGLVLRALALLEMKRPAEARSAIEAARKLDPSAIDVAGVSGLVAVASGDTASATRARRELATRADSGVQMGRHRFWEARIAAAMGDFDEAVMLLRAAARGGALLSVEGPESDIELFDVRLDPALAPVRNTPAFRQVVEPWRASR